MKRSTEITTLFLDIDGVLLTEGWDHHARKRAATNFKLELAEMEDRHHLTFDTFEEGKLTLEEYLGRVVFYEERPFPRVTVRVIRTDEERMIAKTVCRVLGLQGGKEMCHED